MSEDLHRKLVAFLGEEFARAEGRQCVRVDLCSAQPGLRGVVLRTWDRHEDPELFDTLGRIEQLATTVVGIAEDHADSFGAGQHRFEVRTLQHLGGRGRHSFRIVASSPDGADAYGGEDAPTAPGVLAQQMRFSEYQMRTNAQLFQLTLGMMHRQVTDANEENAKLRKERSSQFYELEAARSRRDERELQQLIAVSADRRKDQAFDTIRSLVPSLAARIMGAGGSSGPSDVALLVDQFAKTLTPDQLANIARMLQPNQQILLMETIRAATKANAPTEPSSTGAPSPSSHAAATGT